MLFEGLKYVSETKVLVGRGAIQLQLTIIR